MGSHHKKFRPKDKLFDDVHSGGRFFFYYQLLSFEGAFVLLDMVPVDMVSPKRMGKKTERYSSIQRITS